MFRNIGRKIKICAKVFCWTGITISVLSAAYMFYISTQPYFQRTYGDGAHVFVIWGSLILIAGPLAAWLSSLFAYGFGELVEKTCIIARNTVPKRNNAQQ